jgi:hypothetical protein
MRLLRNVFVELYVSLFFSSSFLARIELRTFRAWKKSNSVRRDLAQRCKSTRTTCAGFDCVACCCTCARHRITQVPSRFELAGIRFEREKKQRPQENIRRIETPQKKRKRKAASIPRGPCRPGPGADVTPSPLFIFSRFLSHFCCCRVRLWSASSTVFLVVAVVMILMICDR